MLTREQPSVAQIDDVAQRGSLRILSRRRASEAFAIQIVGYPAGAVPWINIAMESRRVIADCPIALGEPRRPLASQRALDNHAVLGRKQRKDLGEFVVEVGHFRRFAT